MWLLMAYDIHDDRRRRQALRGLRRASDGYQDSLFEVALADSDWSVFWQTLRPCFSDDDRLLVYRADGPGPSWQLGHGATASPSPLLWVV